MEKITTGISSFENLRKGGYAYVAKTDLVTSASALAAFFEGLAEARGEFVVLVDEYDVPMQGFYKLPEGAENNPGNPATFASDLQSEIRLLNPTMDGYSFVGWTPVGVIPAGTTGMVDFQALFDILPPLTRSGVMLLFK